MQASRASIRFLPSGREIAVAPGTPLLEAVLRAGLPVARGCGAAGICARCGLHVQGRVAPEDAAETERKRANRIDPRLRLACRVRVETDLVVTAPYW